MINEKFVFLAVALNFVGGFSYLIDTVKGRVKPNKVTWFLWGLAPIIAFAAEVQQEVGLTSLMTLTVGLSPFLIFVASFINKKADWKITSFDITCGALSLIGLSLWGITRVGNLAIFFAILADGLAAVPTLIKSYKFPETENYQAFLFAGIGALITLFTVKNWNFANYAFPIYIVYLFYFCFTYQI